MWRRSENQVGQPVGWVCKLSPIAVLLSGVENEVGREWQHVQACRLGKCLLQNDGEYFRLRQCFYIFCQQVLPA